MEIRKLYINGQWVEALSKDVIDVENPLTHEVIAKVPAGGAQDVDRAVASAKAAFPAWSGTSLDERVALMEKVLAGMRENIDNLADTVTAELGSPPQISRGSHVEPYMLEIENYIEIAKSFEFESVRNTSVVVREPVGVVAGLTPWNYPLEQIEKKVVPALLTGNCIILKPSQFTPLTAYILAEQIDKAGYPPGVFALVTGRGGEVGNALALHPDVDMVSFTGSTDAGREVARLGLSNIKKIALELGGKSAAVLLEDGDWEYGVRQALDTVVLNGGQTCNATTRLLVPRGSMAAVEEIILRQLKDYRFGPYSDPDVNMGPLSSRRQFDRVRGYIQLGIEEGARLLTDGVPEDNGDYFVAPTVFSDVTRDMRIAQEEIFGPVLVVIPYDNMEDAIDIANDSIYGLGGSVFGPQEQAEAVARRIRTGSIYVNKGQWDVAAPFGGYKQSGLGREGAVEGFEEFLEIKSIFNR